VKVTARFTDAVELAREAHDEVTRKSTNIPYLAHVMSVAALVFEAGGDEDQAIAGLLHDVAEDAGGESALANIAEHFGDRVAAIVRSCSDSLVEDPADKAPWGPRKVAYLRSLANTSNDAIVVSACDKLHNARSILADLRAIGDEVFARFNADAGVDGVLWYYTALADALSARLEQLDDAARQLASELRRTVQQMVADVASRHPDIESRIAARASQLESNNDR